MTAQHHAGQRLSLKGQLLSVRYVGPVDGKSGEWLGVEWDDSTRGKHDGVHEGNKYFGCRSKSPSCASFLRSQQPWDKHRTFLEALREKYVSQTSAADQEAIYFSTKQAEEVGFDKFARRQAELRGIHVLVLDRMRIRHRANDPDVDAIGSVCKEITELDIGGNFFETLGEVYDLCRRLPKLRSLTLDGNRFSVEDMLQIRKGSSTSIRTLSLSNVLLDWGAELVPLLQHHFSGVQTLAATNNEWSVASDAGGLPPGLKTLDLSNNDYTALADLSSVACSSVETLVLKNCTIATIVNTASTNLRPVFRSVQELDVRHNKVAVWNFFDQLPASFPSIKHLRTTGNPLYSNLRSHDGKALAAEDGYMLTIARLPSLETLNYSKITDKDRLNADTYYLGLIAAEISAASTDVGAADVRERHPRFGALCEKYGEPTITRKTIRADGEIDPDSLAARLVRVMFSSGTLVWTEELPKSLSIYALLGNVSKKLGVLPLRLRLVLETDERDPVSSGPAAYEGPDWWCSDSDDEDAESQDTLRAKEAQGQNLWAMREVEMRAGTRALGTYVEGADARVRVEARG
ncbi:hypothetical protein B0A55_01163 [Friedmanniomyces simplex]|uniref:CAP-Gly domain-containing protein n=1 Tax=Friedmanniomyces simplex TaxID=329884 RepID=A0A4U0Y2D7_9PEZI|nr:hypothetical protein B0A55_01163 [Friedmanniomyces simplex]